jgi:hypothetical protein
MSDTEPRRIRRIIREPVDAGTRELQSPDNPPMTEEEVAAANQKAAANIRKQLNKPRRSRSTLTYALTKPRAVEGYVTLTELAAERGIQAQLARLWVKRCELPKPADGWMWKEGSRDLKRARKALGLPS